MKWPRFQQKRRGRHWKATMIRMGDCGCDRDRRCLSVAILSDDTVYQYHIVYTTCPRTSCSCMHERSSKDMDSLETHCHVWLSSSKMSLYTHTTLLGDHRPSHYSSLPNKQNVVDLSTEHRCARRRRDFTTAQNQLGNELASSTSHPRDPVSLFSALVLDFPPLN